ncbi:MAG: hypothetical protein PSV26_18350 [Polaromonas sp.]|uniref:hypothetical protein n=1 Tax=Polaromonas sp. TaxID=1869339 RepID=UPI0024877537|nr:hypothetical protein [Polaromonas sp.]MDI1239447.1 hypothetical protein [Polaromonas sp.]
MRIDDSVGKVEEGSSKVAEAGKTMDEILDSVKRVTNNREPFSRNHPAAMIFNFSSSFPLSGR